MMPRPIGRGCKVQAAIAALFLSFQHVLLKNIMKNELLFDKLSAMGVVKKTAKPVMTVTAMLPKC